MAPKTKGAATATSAADATNTSSTTVTEPVEKKPAAPRVLKGDPKGGVRAHPSYDHPGSFYMVEASSRKRVANGYHTVAEILEIAKTNGWEFLGVVDVRGNGKGEKLYDKDSVKVAIEAHGRFLRKTTAKPEGEVEPAAATA